MMAFGARAPAEAAYALTLAPGRANVKRGDPLAPSALDLADALDYGVEEQKTPAAPAVQRV